MNTMLSRNATPLAACYDSDSRALGVHPNPKAAAGGAAVSSTRAPALQVWGKSSTRRQAVGLAIRWQRWRCA